MTIHNEDITGKHAVSIELEKIVNSWLDSTLDLKDNKGRLSLLPAPTGSGKSHAIAKIMGERAISSFPHVSIYIVHTKENLKNQYLDLIRLTPEAKSKTILLKEDAEMVVDFFERECIDEWECYDEYQNLKKIVDATINLKKLENNSENDSQSVFGGHMSLYRDPINKEKKSLQERLIKEYKKLKQHQRKGFKETVSRLFPTADLQKYKAIFLTTKKFMYPLWTLSGSTYLYEMEDFKDSKLYVDEFDAQKNQILDMFTEIAANSIIDKISFFLNARHVLKESIFLEKYRIDKKHIDSIKKQFEEVYSKYIRGFSFVYRAEEDAVRYILRSELISSFESVKTPLTIKRDEEKHINWVVNGKDYAFADMLKGIDAAIRRLAGLGKRVVSMRKEEVYDRKEKSGSKEWIDWIHVRDSIMRQFIREFNMHPKDESYKYFKQLILHRLEEDQYTLLSSEREDFYDHGLSLIQTEDSDEDTKHSHFNFYNLNRTPESFLVKVASNMHIIAISATASIETVIRNFDLAYLKTKIHVDLLENKEIKKLNDLYIKGKGQEHRPFHVDFVDVENISIDEIVELWYNNDRTAKKTIEGFLRPFCASQNHTKFRYIRLMYLYWEFITQKEIKSFLVLLNAYPDNDKTITRRSLVTLFSMMLFSNIDSGKLKDRFNTFALSKKVKNKYFTEDELFFVAKSTEFSKKEFIDEIQINRLANGRSVFVMSVYQAMGAGRNIHYGTENGEKDYDAIFCEKPTHLLVRGWGNGNPIESMLKLLYQIHALYASYSIDKSTFTEYLIKAMAVNEVSWKSIKYSSGEDYYNAVMITVIQAIGRLHRANNPNDPMFIYLDEGLRESIERFDTTGHTLLPSVIKILEEANNQPEEFSGKALEFNRLTVKKSMHMRGKIHKMLKSFTDERTVEKYEKYKTHLLSNPTMQNLDNKYYGLYTPESPRDGKVYWYKEEDDYKLLEVSPVKRDNFIEVSESSARLNILTKVPELSDCFRDENITTDFKYTHLMTPVVFNNLYKGILGETIGKWILEKYCGINLNNIPVEDGFYEFFDYISDNNIAVDFKYYSKYRIENTTEDDLRLGGTGAIAKRKAMGVDLAIIVNILNVSGLENVSREISIKDGVAIVPFLIDASNLSSPSLDKQILGKIRELFL